MKSLPLAPMSLRPLPHLSDALSGDTRRLAFAPFALVWIAPCDIRIILLTSQINQRELAPARNPPLKLEVIFCVRGVIIRPCGVPCGRSTNVPAGMLTGALSHLSMYNSTHLQSVC